MMSSPLVVGVVPVAPTAVKVTAYCALGPGIVEPGENKGWQGLVLLKVIVPITPPEIGGTGNAGVIEYVMLVQLLVVTGKATFVAFSVTGPDIVPTLTVGFGGRETLTVAEPNLVAS
jgi:hypothetical protein